MKEGQKLTDKKLKKRVKDTFLSDEIKQCPDVYVPNRKRKAGPSVDRILEITKSCDDLAIDG